MADFTAGAWIVGGRVRHDINLDHFGDLSTLNVVLDERIGSQEKYTPLHFVLEWLVERMLALEGSNHNAGGFSANAYILGLGETVDLGGGEIHGVFGGFAALQDSYLQSFYIDAVLGLVFSMDATIRGQQDISVNAVVV